MNRHPFTICLWFDNQAEEAAKFYTSIFKDGKVGKIHRYGKAGYEFHKRAEGSVMTVDWVANGTHFQGLNGGPIFKMNESVSLVVYCDTQKEIDYFWEKLSGDGGQEIECGWVKDKFGLPWQIVPAAFEAMMDSEDRTAVDRAMSAMFTMKKFDLEKLQKAFKGY